MFAAGSAGYRKTLKNKQKVEKSTSRQIEQSCQLIIITKLYSFS